MPWENSWSWLRVFSISEIIICFPEKRKNFFQNFSYKAGRSEQNLIFNICRFRIGFEKNQSIPQSFFSFSILCSRSFLSRSISAVNFSANGEAEKV